MVALVAMVLAARATMINDQAFVGYVTRSSRQIAVSRSLDRTVRVLAVGDGGWLMVG